MSTKMQDEGSEEGEIVDSDEEHHMRKRIKELEAKNDELEKIASISGDYTNQYRYLPYKGIIKVPHVKKALMSQKDVARIPSDASSISSDEMEPIKKRVKRKGRHSRKDHCKKCRSRSTSLHKQSHRSHKSENRLPRSEEYCRKHNKFRSRKTNPPLVSNENYLETISLDSDEDSDRHKTDSSKSDYEGRVINRDELRFALARTKETKTSGNLLKERLCNGNALSDHKENINNCEIVADSLGAIKSDNKSHISEQSLEISDKDECDAQEEQELRLIALKSAVLKKHFARVKRNAEMAYSPTDFAPVAVDTDIADDNMDVVEEELDELNDVMEISPINSPKLVLSPCNEGDLSHYDYKLAGDNNSIDMDIEQSDSEAEFDNNKHEQAWYPIESAPITKHSMNSNEVLNYPMPVHYGIYVPEMQYQMPPPPLIKQAVRIDNEEQPPAPGTNMYTDYTFDEEPPPPPSMYIEIKDDDEPPPAPSTLDIIPNLFSLAKYDEEPPPPPPCFPENTNSTTRNVFERLGTKTEESRKEVSHLHNPFITNESERDDVSQLYNSFNINESERDESSNLYNPFDTNETGSRPNLSDDENKDSDEEVSALRAVLLSKLQTSKSLKREHAVKKVSEQFLPNLEIVCHTDDKPENNGIETVLQKALRRLKSNFSSSENDAREVRVKEDCLNTATLMVEVVNSDTDTEELDSLSTKTEPQTEKKTTSTRNKIMRKIKSFGSRKALNLIKNTESEKPEPTTATELSEPQAKETYASTDMLSELTFESNSEVISGPTIPDNTTQVGPTSEEAEKIKAIEIEKPELGEGNKTNSAPIGTKEIRKITLKEKPKQLNTSLVKTTVFNENTIAKDANSKKKRLNSVTPLTVPQRTQPLSAKNTLNTSSVLTLKSAQNFLQSALNKVRTTRTTKIVRPNKVINKEITTNIKRAMTPTGSPTQPAKIQRTVVNTNAKITNTTTSTAPDIPPKITVKKLVISLRASDTETSDEELMKEVHVPVDHSIDRVRNIYNEIDSPLELLMNSASCSPARSKNTLLNETTVSANSDTTAVTPVANAAFEQKLDAFLKGIRKRGSQENIASKSPNCAVIKKTDSVKNFNTPTAVRHLPLASQDEYRRLIHRMKLLEKQKQSKKSDEEITMEASKSKNIPVTNSTNSTTQTEDKVAYDNAKSATKKNVQLKTLSSYEHSFEQTSDNIVKLLNKSLSLVAEAKKAKIAKLRHEKRLQELRAEMAKIQTLYEQEERKFSSMQPHIGASNQFLTALKKKRRNLLENANKLGRTLKGDKYRLNNKTGEEIIAKSRKLHAEIKLVNSLKTENIETILLSHSKSTVQSDSAIVFMESNNKNDAVAEKSNEISTKTSVICEVSTEVQKKDAIETFSEAQKPNEQAKDMNTEQNKNSYERCEEENMALMGTTVEHTQKEAPDTAEEVETEKRVELEIQHEDNAGELVNDLKAEQAISKSVVPVYISPLDHFRHEYRNIDSNAIICPYEMWGKCADKRCNYMHMTIGKRRGSELAFEPINAKKL